MDEKIAIASIVALASCAGCGVETYREDGPAADLSMRFVSDASDAVLVPRLGGGEPLALEPRAIVAAEHVRHVRLLDAADGARVIVLDLDDRGRDRLREASRRRIGHRIAVVASGRIIAAPTIRNELRDNEAFVSVPSAELEAAFAAMTARGAAASEAAPASGASEAEGATTESTLSDDATPDAPSSTPAPEAAPTPTSDVSSSAESEAHHD